ASRKPPPPLPPPSKPTEATLRGYRLVLRLGYGRTSEMFLATREGTPLVEEPVIVKRGLENAARGPAFVRRFINAPLVRKKSEHPHLVKVLAAGLIDGRCCLAEEYLEGQPLRAVLRRATDAEGLQRELAVYVAACVLDGLHHAHEATDETGASLGVVHRD